jgi:hypothetical protein
MVIMPDFPLPSGWSKSSVEVKFVAPAGYPFAPPDCFWTESDLRLANGNPPQASQPNPCPDGSSSLWFSWHLQHWNPNTDNLVTYLRVIERRFAEVR